jgi:hypothetical protein
MDFIENLPESQGFDAILVVVDRFSKEARFVATKGTMNAVQFGEVMLREIFSQKGFPDAITSDRGKLFVSKFWRETMRLLKIETRISTPYHPQTDGQTERINQQLKGYLRTYCGWEQDDWLPLLPMAEFTYNNSVHSSTKLTPFFATRGYHPKFDLENDLSSTESVLAGAKIAYLDDLWREMELWIEVARDRAAFYYNARQSPEPEIQVGDRVLVDANFVRDYRKTSKLANKLLGPWEVTEKVGALAYRVKLPETIKRHPVFHVTQLEPFRESTIPHQIAEPGLVPENDDEAEYEIERIVNSRTYKGGFQYQVVWKGYSGPEAVQWINLEDVNAEDAIEDFHLLNPTKPKPPGRTDPIGTRMVFERSSRKATK